MGNIFKSLNSNLVINQLSDSFNIELLPKEILCRFADHLTPFQIHTLQNTSKGNQHFFCSDYIWKIKFRKHFSNDVLMELEKQFQNLPEHQPHFWQSAFWTEEKKEHCGLSVDERRLLFIIKEQDVQSLNILLDSLSKKINLIDFFYKEFKKVTYMELVQQINYQPLLDLIYSYMKIFVPHALHMAIECRQPVMELRLFSKYARSKNQYGFAALYLAANTGNVLAIKFLCVEQRINPDAIKNRAPDGSMPLYIAAQNGHTEAVRELLEAGATIESIFREGYTPLYIASQNGHAAVVKLLLQKHANKNAKCQKGSTPLYIAAQEGHLAVVEMLLEAGAEIEATFKTGYTPLYIACKRGHESVALLLLQKQANPHVIGEDGSTPIYTAAQNGHTRVVSLLLDYGANIEQKWKGMTPFCTAAQNGHLKTVQLLWQRQANTNALNKDGLTPLYLAAQNAHPRTVRLLLKMGARVGDGKINDIKNPTLKILLTLKAYIDRAEPVQTQHPDRLFSHRCDPHVIAAKDFLTNLLSLGYEQLVEDNLQELIDRHQSLDEDLVAKLRSFIPSKPNCIIM